MNREIVYAIAFCFILNAFSVQAYHCPALPENGKTWDQDYKKGIRCILRCKEGFSPSGCYVIRKEKGIWNSDIPKCIEESHTATTIVKYVAIGGATAIGAPYALAAAGFTTAGVAAGSLAAWLQGPVTAAGSWFAAAQSAGVVGMAATTQAGIGTAAVGASKVANDVLGYLYCERE